MISKIFRSLLIFCIAGGVLSFVALTAFAEEDGDKNCSGMVMGTTVEENTNAGQTYFDSHGGPANMAGLPLAKKSKYEQIVDLSIIGLVPGLAPANREQAACAEAESGTYNDPQLGAMAYEYGLQGYAWNDNLGFLSFYCDGGQNTSIVCGGFDYGVKVGAEVNGKRDLFGYAWNSAFGYLKFKGKGSSDGKVGPYTLEQDAGGGVAITMGEVSYTVSFINVAGGKPVVKVDAASKTLTVGQKTNYGNVAITVTDLTLEQPPVVTAPVNLVSGGSIEVSLNGIKHQIIFVQNSSSVNIDGTVLNFPVNNVIKQKVGNQDLYINGGIFIFAAVEVFAFTLDDGGTPTQITFNAQYAVNQSFDYGVTMDANGNLSGYAWTQAGVWMNFSGAQIELPGKEVEIVEGETWCKTLPKPGACVEVTTTVGGGGNGGYGIDVYLKDPVDGADPLEIDDYNISLTFIWEDTVKINQLAFSEAVADLSIRSTPWKDGKGGVLYKPITINNADLKTLFTEVEDGHYVLNQKIISFAPTTDKNFSMTTSTTPAMPFKNEVFADKLALPPPNNTIWSIKENIEENNLILKSINYTITPKDGGAAKSDVIYPNGKGNGYEFQFEPLISLDTLYTSDNDDSIIGFRGLPISFYAAAVEKNETGVPLQNKYIYLALDYDKTETQQGDACNGTQYKNFDYHFHEPKVVFNKVVPQELSYVNSKWKFTLVDLVQNSNTLVHAMKYSLDELAKDSSIQINAIATLLDYDAALAVYNAALEQAANSEGAEALSPPALPCDSVTGPTLYSVITYKAKDIKSGKSYTVYYYGNKLPRLLTEGFNPSAVVTGNIYSSNAFSATSSHTTQATGNVAIDIFRNTINENIEKQLGDINIGSSNKCTITELNNAKEDITVTCEGGGTPYTTFDVEDEHVIYFKGTDVVLDLDKANGDSKLLGKWALIIQDAALYIDDDIYHKDMDSGKLAIVVLRSYAEECKDNNIYLQANVKDIDANIVSDCSLFSYDSVDQIGDDGLPAWTYDEMINKLNVQKSFRGSLAIRNTLGGADLPAIGKEYIQLGTGEVYPLPVDEDQKFEAMMYDINYFAFFRLKVEMSDTGLPIDQSCGKALTVDEMIQIKAIDLGLAPEGTEPIKNGDKYCNGIDVTSAYNSEEATGGDLMPEVDTTLLAKGRDNEKDFAPLYIDYVPSDSFVFKKAGEITTK